MLDSLWEEQPSCVRRQVLLVTVQEEVLVQLVKGKERETCEAINDGRDNAVTEG